MDFKERLAMIRKAYQKEMPRLREQWESGDRGRMDPYFVDWIPMFTPIEMSVWQDIRSAGLPLLPQVPALQYFIDFANPFEKIAIECDGKAWHDEEKDAKRDAALMAEGWTIYRITGSECNRIRPAPWEFDESDHTEESRYGIAREFFLTTATGIMFAIGHIHFPRPDGRSKTAEKYFALMLETLILHSPNRRAA